MKGTEWVHKRLTLMLLLLLALAACSAPVSETATSEEAAPTEAVAMEETSAEADETAVEPAITCQPAAIPAAGEGEVMLRFLNLSGEAISGAWHDTGQTPSQLIEYFQVEDRQAFDQATFAGHEWLVRDGAGETLVDYVASDAATQCVVVYPHYGYEGEAAPDNWAELSDHYETCATGQEQSPIDLTSAAPTDLANIAFEYGESAVNIINNGHTVQVNVTPGSRITINGETYDLAQFHFHAPSEHTVDGQFYPLELHLVHRGASGNLAVVGVLIDEGAANAAYAPVVDQLPEEQAGILAAGATVQLAGLLPAEQTVYRYEGSLTTPPCSEGVLWSVMNTPVELSAEQVAAFAAIMDGNNRPIQPLDARALELDTTP